MAEQNIYLINGYKNHDDYLKYLSNEYDIHISTVKIIASMLGKDEDFDGLVSSLEDYESKYRS